MSTTLSLFQKTKPDLWGTLEEAERGRPTRYVDVYNPKNKKGTYLSSDQLRAIESEQDKKIEDDATAGIENAMLEAPVQLPKYMHAIPLEVVEGGDAHTFMAEATNMINMPFGKGAPLMEVRIVRHPGGTDLLISGHQSIFDELSFESACCEMLAFYATTAEGRVRDLVTDVSPMLWNVDNMYPTESFESFDGFSAALSVNKNLDKLAKERAWSHLPWNLGSDENGTYSVEPPSPALNTNARMNATLNLKYTRRLRQICDETGLPMSAFVTAAVLRQTGALIASKTPIPPSPPPSSMLSRLFSVFSRSNTRMQASQGEKPETHFMAGLIVSLRSFFDPPVPAAILGPLTSYLLMPTTLMPAQTLFDHVKSLQRLIESCNETGAFYRDIGLLPHLTTFAQDDQHWKHPAVPTIWISETVTSALSNDLRLRMKIYDVQNGTSCWTPGAAVSSRYDAELLSVNLTYRRPLIADHDAKELLERIMKDLTL